MTAPAVLDLETVEPTPIEGVPNHRATSGERGDGGEGLKRPGIFGAGKKSGRSPKARNTDTVPPLDAAAKKKLEEFYIFAGMGVMPFDKVLSGVIIEQAPICAEALYNAAQDNEQLRRFIIMLTTTSMYGALIAAHLPILLTAAARHAPNENVKNMGVSAMFMMFQRDVRDPEEDEPNPSGVVSE